MTPSRLLRALLALCLSAAAAARAQNPAISANQTDTFAPNGAGRATPGNNITYSIEITNSGTGNAQNVSLSNPTPANTAFVPGSMRTTCLAIPDTYACLGNVPIVIAAAAGVLANDTDPDGVGPALTATAISDGASSQGGVVNLAADGSFTYNPPVGYEGTDTFSYTLNDNEGNTDTTTVTVTVSGMIWFINENAATNGDGRLATPFSNLAAFQAINNNTGNNPGNGDSIFLYESADSYTGGITLLQGQRLIGQDATGSLATLAGVTPPTGSAALPTMSAGNGVVAHIVNPGGNGVTLGPNSRIHGFTAGNASGTAIIGSGVGTIQVSDVIVNTTGAGLGLSNLTLGAGSAFTSVTSTGGATGVSLDSVAGTAALGSGALSGHSSNAVSISGGGGSVTYSGSITKASGSGVAVNVSGKSGGTVTISGAVTATGAAGVNLASNTGATVAFTGGLNLNSGTNIAFTATGGGTVTATQNNTTIVNTLATTSGQALNVANTTIGAAGLTFRSISAGTATGSAGNGIVLDGTGSSGGLTVTGTGTAGSGGTIQNKTGADGSNTAGIGIRLNNTRNVSLAWMQLSNFQNFGIKGSNVTNFTMSNTTVNATAGTNGTAMGEGGASEGSVRFDNLLGSASIADCVITHGIYDNFGIFNTTGTLNRLTVTNTDFATSTTSGQGNDAVRMEAYNAGTVMNATFTGDCDFTAARGDLIDIIAQTGSTVDIVVTGNDFTNNHAAIVSGGGGVIFHGGGTMTFRVEDNDLRDARGRALNVSKAANGGTFSGTIHNNRVGVAGVDRSGSKESSGIYVDGGSLNHMTVAITNNVIHQYNEAGIFLVANNQAGAGSNGTFNATVTGNTTVAYSGEAPVPLAFAGLWADIGTGSGFADATSAFLDIGGAGVLANNFSQGDPYDNNDISISDLTTTPVRLPGYGGGPEDMAAVQSYLLGRNNVAGTTVIAYSEAGDNGYVNGTAFPLLFTPAEAVPTDSGYPRSTAEAVVWTEKARAAATAAHEAVPVPASEAVASEAKEPAAATPLTQQGLDSLVAAARQRWEATGLTEAQREALGKLVFEVSDLPGWYLGEARGLTLRLDLDAGGHGWFIDPTPSDDSEFSSSRLPAPASGRVDLLTTLMHEMGHALGLFDTYAPADRDRLMYGFLGKGERRVPRAGEAEGSVPLDFFEPRFLSSPVNIGTLPAGKSITVTFEVTINAGTTATAISSQGTVTAADPDGGGPLGPISVQTNDPATPAAGDPTITPVEQRPSVTNIAANGLEDTQLGFTASQFTAAFSDLNGDSLARVRVTSLPANGTLRAGVTPVNVNDEILAANLGSLNFLPAANFNGMTSFGYTASDGQGFAPAPALVNITIVAVNDEPTLDPIPPAPALPEDSGQQTINLTGIGAGGGETQVLTVTASSDNASLIPNPVSVTYTSPASSGSLSYTPLANAHGTATITVTVQDDGGTADGGDDTITRQFTVVVNPVADTPSITNATTLPNTQTTTGLVVSRNAADGAEVTHFRITNVQNGTVFLNDGTTSVSSGSFVVFADASAGLKFTPAANFQGDATFDVQASTSNAVGGLGGGVVTATISVNERVSIDTANPGDDEAAEGGVDSGVFTFTRGGTAGTLVANFALDPSSTTSASDFGLVGASVDYNAGAGTGTVTFPDGQNTVQATLVAGVETPNAAEADETVRFNIVPVPGTYLAGTPDNATVTILQNGFAVTNTNDSGEGSLRQAVLNANAISGADTVTFEGGTFTDGNVPDVIELTGGMIDLASHLTVAGLGADLLVVKNVAAFGPANRVFNVISGSTAILRGLTITGGSTINGGGIVVEGGATSLDLLHCVVTGNTASSVAGGIAAGPGSTLNVIHSTISNNTANGTGGSGGGIDFDGAVLRVVNSTISGNSVPNGSNNGAGIWTQAGTTTIVNATISGNLAGGADSAGGLRAHSGSTVIVANSIVAGNQNNGTVPDVVSVGTLTSNGGNLVGNAGSVVAFDQPGDQTGTGAAPLDPLLGPLADNGGPTPTHALLLGSPALNAGLDSNLPADTLDLDGDGDTGEPVPFDQRGTGFTRAIGTVDAGAFELQKSVSITALDAAKAEGSGAGTTPFTFTVARTGPTDGSVTMDYAVTGATANPADAADFGGTLPSGQFTIPEGEASAVLTIDVSRDATVEPVEGFTVTLDNPDNGYIVNGATADGTIQNDDSATLTLAGGISVNEGAAGTTGMVFAATLDNPVQGGFSVAYATNDGTATAGDGDYQDNDGSLVFTGTAGEQHGFTVLVNGDDKVEADESFTVTLGTVTGGHGAVSTAGSPQTGTITNDDSAVVSIAGNVSQPETAGPQTFTVTLSHPVDIDVTVDYATSDGTAVAPGDYTAASGTLTFPAGTTTAQSVNVAVIDDGEVEGDEVFNIALSTLSAPSRDVALGTGAATGTILNDDIFTVTIHAVDDSADENTADTGIWRVSRGGTFGDLVVGLAVDAASTASAADWTQAGASFVSTEPGGLGTVTIPDGALFADIVLTPADDLAAEADETVILNVTASGTYLVATSPANTVTIARNDFGVTHTGDSGEGSLRQAVENANAIPGADTITFEGPVFADATPDTIVLSDLGGTELAITEAVTLAGPGADLLTISGNLTDRILFIDSPAGATVIRGVTLTNGYAIGAGNSGTGGAILMFGAGSTLLVEDCHITGNFASSFGGGVAAVAGSTTIRNSTISGNVVNATDNGGGGIYNAADLTLLNSTISGNSAVDATTSGGGGILNTGTLQVLHSTVTGNRANPAVGGGGIEASGTETIRNSIVAGNFEGTGTDPSDIGGGSIDTAAFVLVGDAGSAGGIVHGTDGNLVGDAGSGTVDLATVLEPVLAVRGGVLPVHALAVGSPAIDAGDPAFDGSAFSPPLSTDQRGAGFDRVGKGLLVSVAAVVDMGAYELFAAPEFTNADLRVSVEGEPVDLAAATGATPPGGTFSGPGVSGRMFDPRSLAPGVYTLTYTVQDAFGASNASTFTVTVLAIPTELVVQKPKRFAPTEVGKRSRTQRVRITNRGGIPATGLRLVVKGPGRADFKVPRPSARHLAVGATTTFRATFRPRKAGNRKATVSVLSNAAPAKAVLLGRGKWRSGSPGNPAYLPPRKIPNLR